MQWARIHIDLEVFCDFIASIIEPRPSSLAECYFTCDIYPQNFLKVEPAQKNV